MAIRISDNRAALAMTVDEADALFQRIAETTIHATVAAAEHERQLAVIKAAAVASQELHTAILRPLIERLNEYIHAHPERFAKPRMRATEFGKYGTRSVSNIEIVDEMAAMISIKAQCIPALIVTEKIDKKAVEKALSDGKEITGVEVRKGEIIKLDVAKTLIDAAINGRG